MHIFGVSSTNATSCRWHNTARKYLWNSDLFKRNPFAALISNRVGRWRSLCMTKPTGIVFNGTGALSPGVKRQGRGADHSPPTSTEIKTMWIYTSTPPYAFMTDCLIRYAKGQLYPTYTLHNISFVSTILEMFSEISRSRKTFGIGHMYMYTFLVRMTDTMTSQNTDLSSWDYLYISSWMALQPSWALASCSVSWSIFLQSAGLLEWVISSSQGLYYGREKADNFAQRPPWGLRFFNVQ
jgi:hypothetical protein